LNQDGFATSEIHVVKPFEAYLDLNQYGEMFIRVLFSNGTAEQTVEPGSICKTLRALEPALQHPRSLWEFQQLQVSFQCEVSKFDPFAYSDFHPKKKK
jgi:hypothetical protein